MYGKNQILGPTDIAVMVMPLRLMKSQVARLREEITEEVPLNKAV